LSQNKQKLFSEILKHGYSGYFVDRGFTLKKIDKKLEHLEEEDKVKMLSYVLEALD